MSNHCTVDAVGLEIQFMLTYLYLFTVYMDLLRPLEPHEVSQIAGSYFDAHIWGDCSGRRLITIWAEAKPKEKSYFAELLDWMTLKFDGDMGKLAEDAMKYVKKKQYAFGPLWDEIGERALRILFAERLRIERNNFGVGSTPSVSTQVGFEPTPTQKDGDKATTIVNNQGFIAKSPKPSVYLTWFHNPRGKASLDKSRGYDKKIAMLINTIKTWRHRLEGRVLYNN